MFRLHIVREIRGGLNNTLCFARRDGRFAANACRRMPLKNQEHVFHANDSRRSFLSAAIEVRSSSQPVSWSRHFCTSSGHHSDDGDLIYTGNLGKAIVGVKLLCYSVSGASLCMVSHTLLRTGLESLALTITFWCPIAVVITITPAFVHLLTRNYVMRLYHDAATDAYTAVSHNALLMERKTVFHQSDVKVPASKQMFTTLVAGQEPLMVNPEFFRSRKDYNRLMGYPESFVEELDEPGD